MEWLKHTVKEFGGPTRVAAVSRLSKASIINIYSGRRPLTPYAVRRLRPVLISVSDGQWLESMLESMLYGPGESADEAGDHV